MQQTIQQEDDSAEVEFADLQLFPADPPSVSEAVAAEDELPHDLLGAELPAGLIRVVERFGLPQRVLVALASEEGDGRYRVLEDPRWVRAAREAGLGRIPVRVLQVRGLAAELLVLILNQQRAANVAAQMDAVERLLAAGISEEQLARASGMTKSQITRLAGLGELEPLLRQALRENRIKAQVAFAAAGLASEVQAELAARFERDGLLTGPQVKEVRERVATEDAGRAPEATEEGGPDEIHKLLRALDGESREDPTARVRRQAQELLRTVGDADLPGDLRVRLAEVVRELEQVPG